MGVPELHALVLDTRQPLAERQQAWRAAMRGPLHAALEELGLFAPTFDEDFEKSAPILDLELGKVVLWALAELRLRCVPVPKDLGACTSTAFRAALTRVTGAEPVIDVVGLPVEVQVTLGRAQAVIGIADPARDVLALLTRWAETTTLRPVCAPDLAIWLANDAQVGAAERLGLRLDRIRVLDPNEAVRALVPHATIVTFEDGDHLGDFDDYRQALVDAACATSARIADVVIQGRHVTLAIDGEAVALELTPMRPRDFRELAVHIFDALATVLEPRLGARPVLAKGDLVVLATVEECAHLRAAGLLE